MNSQFCLSWDEYKSSLCSGFSSLQQNGEFVDMTLAADGHFVKVHQVLMALVSPYLKELITSAPCQHPVIYLNNVSFRTLSYLLEYIYTGEVLVQSDYLLSFIDTAKSLHIRGLENVANNVTENVTYKVVDTVPQVNESVSGHVTGLKTLSVPDSSSTPPINLPPGPRKICIKRNEHKTPQKVKPELNIVSVEQVQSDMDYTDVMDSGNVDSDDGYNMKEQPEQDNNKTFEKNTITKYESVQANLQFTVSIRGRLQVILNRYIYNLNSTTSRTGVRRWRCVEYRNHRCKANISTKGNVVLNRSNLHNHPFHDKKILQKIEKQAVFSELDEVEGYKKTLADLEKGEEDAAMNSEDY